MIYDKRQNRRIANMAQLGYSEEDMCIGRERDAKAQRKRERRQERNTRNEFAQGRGPEGLTLVRGGWVAECCICGKDYVVDAPASDFHPDVNYCGGSPRCCP